MSLRYPNRLRYAYVPLLAGLLLAGCGGKRPPGTLANGAELVTQRKGGVAFFAPQDGLLLIVDQESGKTVFSIPMVFGDKLWFSPEKNNIRFNGTLVKDGGLDTGHVYQFYFLKG